MLRTQQVKAVFKSDERILRYAEILRRIGEDTGRRPHTGTLLAFIARHSIFDKTEMHQWQDQLGNKHTSRGITFNSIKDLPDELPRPRGGMPKGQAGPVVIFLDKNQKMRIIAEAQRRGISMGGLLTEIATKAAETYEL